MTRTDSQGNAGGCCLGILESARLTGRLFAVPLLVLLLGASCCAAAGYSPERAVGKVGTVYVTWHDAGRNRNVPAKVYYPANAKEPCPVIIFSHGLGGNREGYAYLGEHWAGCGYISVHLQHIGSDDSVWIGAGINGFAALKRSAA